jgi:hypothetical protein
MMFVCVVELMDYMLCLCISDYVGACVRLRMLNLRNFYDVCVSDYI